MKVITIRQPWATLIALGEKRYETRSWQTAHRGVLAIHAGQTLDQLACRQEPIATMLQQYGFTAKTLPLGAVIATCQLVDCLRVAADKDGRAWLERFGADTVAVDGNEYRFGDYAAGRYAWELREVTPVRPSKVKGRLSLWEWDPPAGLLEDLPGLR
ncbi:ASCH domain-containing protein [Paenibacillus athensensis]|uniref:ASCH domain-containing protein n=1 Tax=Paenibacillus athensensis TaxID=1967502 RepID=A0A4Y8Q720_9BACL|nr:ASCH domain-containing protein [Paenibacillus athensensis]MCD1257421.1 ASCH domain-containing protein [Paenibacillus athensensis]